MFVDVGVLLCDGLPRLPASDPDCELLYGETLKPSNESVICL
jgi:hypothetical protein